MDAAQYFLAPFANQQSGLSHVSLGDLLTELKAAGPGRYPITNSQGTNFCIIVYNDLSWRATTSQLTLFAEYDEHRLSEPPPGASPRYVEHLATKSPHTLT